MLENQLATIVIERGVELWKLLQCLDTGLDQKRHHAQFAPAFFGLFVMLLAKRFQLGDIGLIMLGDVRDGDPVAVQMQAGFALDTRQRLLLDVTELAEVDLFAGWHVDTRCATATADPGTNVLVQISFGDATLAAGGGDLIKINFQLARQLAYARAGMRSVAGVVRSA
jgi:hypothetical protein